MFASNLRKLGGEVNMVVWKQSEHVAKQSPFVFFIVLSSETMGFVFLAHFRRYAEEYTTKVRRMLENASSTYTKRLRNAFKEDVNVDFPYLSEFAMAEINHMSMLTHDTLKLSSAKSMRDDAFHIKSKL